MIETQGITVTQTAPGRVVEFRGQRSARRLVTVDREWEVSVDGEVVGYITYRMMTRERRTPGRTYVNSRWQSPVWETRTERLSRGYEAMTKKDAIERLVSEHASSRTA